MPEILAYEGNGRDVKWQSLYKTAGQFLMKLNVHLSYDPVINMPRSLPKCGMLKRGLSKYVQPTPWYLVMLPYTAKRGPSTCHSMNHKCLYMTEAKGDLTTKQEESNNGKDVGEIRERGHRPRNAGGLHMLEDERKRLFPRASGGSEFLWHHDFSTVILIPDFWLPEQWKTNFCWFKPPSPR